MLCENMLPSYKYRMVYGSIELIKAANFSMPICPCDVRIYSKFSMRWWLWLDVTMVHLLPLKIQASGASVPFRWSRIQFLWEAKASGKRWLPFMESPYYYSPRIGVSTIWYRHDMKIDLHNQYAFLSLLLVVDIFSSSCRCWCRVDSMDMERICDLYTSIVRVGIHTVSSPAVVA